MRLLLASLAVPLAFAACSAPRLDVIPRYGKLDIEGEMALNDADDDVSTENDVDDLGLEEDDSVPGARADLDFGSMNLTLMFANSDHGGEGTLEAEISDGEGNTIAAGTEVESEFDMLLYEAIVTFDLVPTQMFEFGLGLGAAFADVDTSFEEQTGNEQVEFDELIPIPVLAARGGVVLGRFDVSLLLSGMDISVDGDSATFLDLDAMARVRFGEAGLFHGGIVLGYRWIDLDVDYEDDDVELDSELEFSGPYVGLNLGF